MTRQTLFLTLAICGAVVIGGAWLATAGDLNPPAGPVAPTMRTLDEIYDLVAASGGPAECPPCVWEASFFPDVDPNIWRLVVPGSGVIHAVIPTRCSSGLWVADGDPDAGGVVIGVFFEGASSGTSMYASYYCPLDVRFENGLYLKKNAGGSQGTVLFRSDP